MGHAKNIVQSNLVKNLLNSYNTLDIELFLSLQKGLYKVQRTHIILASETHPSASVSCWHLRSHCCHLAVTHLPSCLPGELHGPQQKCFQKSIPLPAEHILAWWAWAHHSAQPPAWPQHGDQQKDLEPELEAGAVTAERANAQAGLCGETWNRENSSMLMLFLFRLLISAAQRNVLCWCRQEVWPALLCILPSRSFLPHVLFALLAQMHPSLSAIPQFGSAMLPSWMEVPEMMFPSHYQVLWGAQLSPTPQLRLHQVPAEKLHTHFLHRASPAFTVTLFASLRFLGLLSLFLKAHSSMSGKASRRKQAPSPEHRQVAHHGNSLRASLEGNWPPNKEVPSWKGNLSLGAEGSPRLGDHAPHWVLSWFKPRL